MTKTKVPSEEQIFKLKYSLLFQASLFQINKCSDHQVKPELIMFTHSIATASELD